MPLEDLVPKIIVWLCAERLEIGPGATSSLEAQNPYWEDMEMIGNARLTLLEKRGLTMKSILRGVI